MAPVRAASSPLASPSHHLSMTHTHGLSSDTQRHFRAHDGSPKLSLSLSYLSLRAALGSPKRISKFRESKIICSKPEKFPSLKPEAFRFEYTSCLHPTSPRKDKRDARMENTKYSWNKGNKRTRSQGSVKQQGRQSCSERAKRGWNPALPAGEGSPPFTPPTPATQHLL